MVSLWYPERKHFTGLKEVNMSLCSFQEYWSHLSPIIGSSDKERYETVNSFKSLETSRCSVRRDLTVSTGN